MKTAIVGCGRMGARFIQIVRDLELDLVGVADQNHQALEKTKEEFKLAPSQVFTDFEKLLKAEKPELTIVATTAQVHSQYTCLAAEAGARFILCEKPIGTSIEQIDQMIKSCERYGAILAVNHQMRFMEQYNIPKKILNTDEFGGLTSVNVLAGNFGLAMNGSHYFEMFRYLTDESPYLVSAWFSEETVPNPRGKQFEDRGGSILVQTKSGKRMYMDCGTDQGHGMQVTYGARFGRITIDELTGKMQTTCRKSEHRNLPTTRYGMPAGDTERTIEPADVLAPSKAVLRALLDKKNYPTAYEGKLAVQVLIAAHVSHEENHRPVSLSEEIPKSRVFPWA